MRHREDALRHGALFFLLALASGGFYLWRSARLEGPGFPLDDAWIHQTYARNLASEGAWSFVSGEPSGGSTAPWWTAMIALGYWLGLPRFAWTFALGLTLLAALGLMGRAWILRRGGGRALAFLVGLMILFEWHLTWAAVSGMETLALAVMVLAVLHELERDRPRHIQLGLLIGAGLWLRPDALSLLVPVLWVMLFSAAPWRQRLREGSQVIAGIALLAIPYLLFNSAVAGAFWPTTFYAKQVEYAELRQLPLWRRWLEQALRPLAGMAALAVPGLVAWGAGAIKQRDARSLAGLIWALSFVSAYAWRLPVTYQHGRYAMPVLAPVLVLGAEALARFWQRSQGKRLAWVVARAWAASWLIVGFLFWVRGARAYAEDVAIINTEMVKVARWLSENTERDALVAAHDIGAIGYFGQRRLLDLAGLISPEVIPILRDEPALARFLSSRGADYLVTFPGWYPGLTGGREPIYVAGEGYAPAAGGENMAVYRWP